MCLTVYTISLICRMKYFKLKFICYILLWWYYHYNYNYIFFDQNFIIIILNEHAMVDNFFYTVSLNTKSSLVSKWKEAPDPLESKVKARSQRDQLIRTVNLHCQVEMAKVGRINGWLHPSARELKWEQLEHVTSAIGI